MKRSNIKLSLIFLILFSFFSVSCLASEIKSKVKKSCLWEIINNGKHVYLLGSIHMMKKEAYPLNPAIEKDSPRECQHYCAYNHGTFNTKCPYTY